MVDNRVDFLAKVRTQRPEAVNNGDQLKTTVSH